MRTIKLLILLSLLVLSGCGRQESNRAPYAPVNVNLSQEQLQAHQQFALDLIRETCLFYSDKNLIFSPLSVQIAMAMLADGIDDASFKEIARAFGMPNATREEFNQFHAQLFALFKRPSEFVAADSTNALFYNQSGKLKADFEQTLRQRYEAEIHTFDPGNPSASADAMNDWVRRATDGEIQTLVQESEIHKLSLGFFLNAFVLDAEWQEYFEEAGERTFHPEKGEPRPIPMLQQAHVSAYADATTIIVRVPFKGREVSYYILTPRREGDRMLIDDTPFKEPITLDQLLQQLTPQRWKQLRAQVQSNGSTEVYMPRFNLASTVEFEEPLQATGIVKAFGQAYFSRMFAQRPPDLPPDYIEYVRQAAKIEVTAERVRVSGGTAVGTAATSVPEILYIDRPFLYLIVHEPTGVIMHAGVLRYPPE
jgi:serine protease inhibitor